MTLPLSFEDIKKLQHKKYRDEFQFFLAEGEHLVHELAKAAKDNPALGAAEVLVGFDYGSERSLPNWAQHLTWHRLSSRQLAALSDTQNPQLIVAVVPILAAPPPTLGEKIIYLHEIQDPGNLGTILRTLAWFGGYRCMLSPNSVDPYNPKVVRASMGAIFHVPIETDVSIGELCGRYPKLAILDMTGKPLSDSTFKDFDGYVFGNEARGLPRDLLNILGDSVFAIAGRQHIDSLNLATAVSICAYEVHRLQADRK
jgi:TrmH family RNA methyltransferase